MKTDGLAAGKGVLLCNTVEEAEKAVDFMLVEEGFGAAGERIRVVDDRRHLGGPEEPGLTIQVGRLSSRSSSLGRRPPSLPSSMGRTPLPLHQPRITRRGPRGQSVSNRPYPPVNLTVQRRACPIGPVAILS